MAGMDLGDKDLLKKSVADNMDIESLSELHYSIGPAMLSTQIVDMKSLPSEPHSSGGLKQYQVRVAIQNWSYGTSIDYWDLIVVENPEYTNTGEMRFLVKSREIAKVVIVDEHKVFPGHSVIIY